MKKEFGFEALASKYSLSIEFLNELNEKVVDKDNFERAVRMFNNGTMPYNIATGKDPINVAELRHKIATKMWAARIDNLERVKVAMEEQRKIVDYYNGCKALKYPCKPKDGKQDVVFVKDGHLVAFSRFEPKQGGIYASDNEVMPNFKWTPHKWLGRLRKLNKAFYRDVKKAAFASPKEWFDFNIKDNE
ncbi:hypothetical protein FACS189432_05170 [Bacteroidia bacterium]|nr:hypothetical protein FACS189426_06600 [Bacteroidia bacterium]GHT27921.1 hypothetical protein FACS189432_05170 [Bacteroidia bacterium]